MSKLSELLQSRRLYAAAGGVIAAIVLHRMGAIDAGQMAKWIETAFELYAGSIGIEHAAKVWRANSPASEVKSE